MSGTSSSSASGNAIVNELSEIQLGHYAGSHQPSGYPSNGGSVIDHSGGSGMSGHSSLWADQYLSGTYASASSGNTRVQNQSRTNGLSQLGLYDGPFMRTPPRFQNHFHQVENVMSGSSSSWADKHVSRPTPQGENAFSNFRDFDDLLELPGPASNSAGAGAGQTGSMWMQHAEGDFPALPAHLQPSFGLQDLHLELAKIAKDFSRNKQPIDDNSSTVPTPAVTLGKLSGNSFFAEPYLPIRQRQQQATNLRGSQPAFFDAGDSDFFRANDHAIIYPSPGAAYRPMVKQDPIGTRLTNRSRSSSSSSVPGMEKRSLHQEGSSSSSRVPLPPGSSFKKDDDKWGLLGMLSTLGNRSLNNIHQGVGIDLTTLGVDFASEGSLFRTFASPWAEEPLKEEPTWSLPACYNENQPPPVNYGTVSKMKEGSLFYIFYSMPKDVLQLYAAHTLASRGWMYHRGIHLWLIKDPNLTYYRLGDNRERGCYIFFNPNKFRPIRKNDFTLDYDLIEPVPELPPIKN